jgi:hypothetical protein
VSDAKLYNIPAASQTIRSKIEPSEINKMDPGNGLNENLVSAGLIENRNLLSNELHRLKTRPPRQLSPTNTIVKEETVESMNCQLTSTIVIPILETQPPPQFQLPSPLSSATHTIIKSERYTEFEQLPCSPTHSTGNLSPTSTIVKGEQPSPHFSTDSNHSTELEDNLLENVSINSFPSRTSSPEYRVKRERSSDYSSRKRRRSSSNERDSTKREKSHKSDSDYDRERKPSSSSSRKRSHKSKSSKKRQSSTESDSHHNDSRFNRQLESGSKWKHNRDRERRAQKKRYRSETETEIDEITSSDEYRSPQPSASRLRKDGAADRWSSTRFSQSPESSPNGSVFKSNVGDDSDYGWEYPAPPKPKPEVQAKSIFEDPVIKEKLAKFNEGLNTEYDLSVMEESKNNLFRAIEETMSDNAKTKLIELDTQIQKKKDDYLKQLFGTDNFDKWDDNPALSNVQMAKKLKPYKSSMPADAPLYAKMTMKNEINTMRLTPIRDGNELMSNGLIKRIETEFQGRKSPSTLSNAIKKKKRIIADIVVKRLKLHPKRIPSNEVFKAIARKISHVFYERSADKNTINKYIDDILTTVAGTITSLTDLDI